MKAVDPPLVLTEFRCLSSARCFNHPVTIPGICGAKALVKLPSAWDREICQTGRTPNTCASAWPRPVTRYYTLLKIAHLVQYQYSMGSMDCCKTAIPIQSKTCNSLNIESKAAALVLGLPVHEVPAQKQSQSWHKTVMKKSRIIPESTNKNTN
jgi:hypothetical protein